jgi:hypothetical protein
MDIPGYGLMEGEWDLRDGVEEYLGGVDFKGRRVLELGTASGFLCFSMEKKGADVVAHDLSEEQSWDIVPYCNSDYAQVLSLRKSHIRRLNNGYWLSHRAFGSQAKVVYGSVYHIPEQIGKVDIATLGSILNHLRDPFLALENALRLTKKTVLITDVVPRLRWLHVSSFLAPLARVLERMHFPTGLIRRLAKPSMQFSPDYRTREPKETWWRLLAEIIIEFIGVLGFEDASIRYHYQNFRGQRRKLYTIVGHRTKALQNPRAAGVLHP